MVQLASIVPFLLFFPARRCVGAYRWPSPQYDALEEQLFEGHSPDQVNVANLVANCRTRNSKGPESPLAAEWVRLVSAFLLLDVELNLCIIRKAYHDVATHNIEDGTGGMDASIFYELDRAEVRALATCALWIHHLCRLAEHRPSNERFSERLRIYINSICIMCALLNCIAPTHYF